MSASHLLKEYCAVESFSHGYGTDAVQANDILKKIDGIEAKGKKEELMKKIKVCWTLAALLLIEKFGLSPNSFDKNEQSLVRFRFVTGEGKYDGRIRVLAGTRRGLRFCFRQGHT